MKILAVDIGNTHTRLAIVESRHVEDVTVVPSSAISGIDRNLSALLDAMGPQKIKPVVVCSVNPSVCDHVKAAVQSVTGGRALVIGDVIPLPMATDLTDASTVGCDRVVSAAMAYERMNRAVVVADFGTAITIDCVGEEGVFLGGAILPGLAASAKAMHQTTAALPLITEPKLGEKPWGRTTAEAISTGLIATATGALRELVERYATELGVWPEVIVTGGDAERIMPHCDFIHATVPDLLLMGIELAYERFFESQSQQ